MTIRLTRRLSIISHALHSYLFSTQLPIFDVLVPFSILHVFIVLATAPTCWDKWLPLTQHKWYKGERRVSHKSDKRVADTGLSRTLLASVRSSNPSPRPLLSSYLFNSFALLDLSVILVVSYVFSLYLFYQVDTPKPVEVIPVIEAARVAPAVEDDSDRYSWYSLYNRFI